MTEASGRKVYSAAEWYVALGILVVGALAFGGYKLFATPAPSHKELIEACHQRGIEYFKGTESYPFMQSEPNKGRRTADVVWERCKRTTNAF